MKTLLTTIVLSLFCVQMFAQTNLCKTTRRVLIPGRCGAVDLPKDAMIAWAMFQTALEKGDYTKALTYCSTNVIHALNSDEVTSEQLFLNASRLNHSPTNAMGPQSWKVLNAGVAIVESINIAQFWLRLGPAVDSTNPLFVCTVVREDDEWRDSLPVKLMDEESLRQLVASAEGQTNVKPRINK